MATPKSSSPPSRIIRCAFGLESAVNILTGTAALFAPEWCLSQVVRNPAFITPTAIFLLQTTGTLLYALTVPLLTCIPNTHRAIASRRTVYYTLGAGEAFLIPLLLWKATAGDYAGIESGTLLSMAGNLVPVLGWRIWCFGWRSEWFGSVEEAMDTKKTQ